MRNRREKDNGKKQARETDISLRQSAPFSKARGSLKMWMTYNLLSYLEKSQSRTLAVVVALLCTAVCRTLSNYVCVV